MLAVLRHPALAALLGGGTAYFFGNAMQVMAAAWLVVELTGSAFLAALVQTAVFLPMFLLRCRPACWPTPPTGAA